MGRVCSVKQLTIANGDTTSDSLTEKAFTSPLIDITVFGPSALTGTVHVEVAPTDNPASGDWVTLQKDGSDVTIPADKATPIAGLFRALRFVSDGAEGADRVFKLVGQGEIEGA